MTQPLTAIQGISQGILEQTRGLPTEIREYLQVVVGRRGPSAASASAYAPSPGGPGAICAQET
jgi:hypothetical protein